MWVLVIICVLLAGGYYMFKQNNVDEAITKEYPIEPFNQLEVDSSADNIRIVTGKYCSVRYIGQKKLKPSVKVENHVLTVKSPEKSVVINGSLFNIKSLKQELIIEMPAKEYKSVSIDTSNGNVSIDNLKVQKGSIDTSNGRVNLNKLTTKNGFEIDSSNGSIRVGKSNAEGFDLSTSNGHVTFGGKNESQDFEKNAEADNTLSIDTSNGNIAVN